MSTRTLRRRLDEGIGPERRLRPRPGQKPQAVYNPRDVELMATPSQELTRAVRFGRVHPLAEPVPEVVVDPVAEARAQLDIVTALSKLSTSEQRLRVLDGVVHLVQAERCVGGLLDGFLKGTKR
ncbi:MAG: hypothetical protein LAP40_23555 [Acidobacteriia bacterium]|nr:hypothetical protein [Terriglobia bacterium]